MRLYAEQRIRKQRVFTELRARGQRVFLKPFIMQTLVLPQNRTMERPQFGVIASRRVGNAVARNRVKRLMRELFRHYQKAFPVKSQTVFVLKPKFGPCTYRMLEEQLRLGLKRLF